MLGACHGGRTHTRTPSRESVPITGDWRVRPAMAEGFGRRCRPAFQLAAVNDFGGVGRKARPMSNGHTRQV